MFRTLFARLGAADTAPPWGLGAAAITIVAAFAAIIIGTLIGAAWLSDPTDPLAIPARAQYAGWLIGCLLTTALVLQTRRTPEQRAALRLDAAGIPLPFVLFIGLGAAIALDLMGLLLTQIFARAPELAAFDTASASLLDWALVALLMLGFQPVAEELVFRGVAWPALRVAAGGWGGWLVSAAVFGLFHFLAYPPSALAGGFPSLWYGLLAPAVEGLFIGGVRAHTSSNRAAMFAHAAFGLFAVVKLIVTV